VTLFIYLFIWIKEYIFHQANKKVTNSTIGEIAIRRYSCYETMSYRLKIDIIRTVILDLITGSY
jgi:hypothetical protein